MQNNPITEIILGILAVLFIAGGVFLLYTGKIDFAGATLMFGFPAALFGINQALKSPSPQQQQNLQQAMSDLTNVIPVIFQHTHTGPPAPPVVAPVPQPKDWIMAPTGQTMPPTPAPSIPFVPIPAAAAQPVQQQPFPPSNTFPLPVVPK